jgi:hypothetical protein
MKSILIPAALALALAAFRELNVRHRRELSMVDIARQINPLLRSWSNTTDDTGYRLSPPCSDTSIQTLRACVMRKFKRAFYPLPCETELSLMITPGISLNGKQRAGLSPRRALIGILGSRASPDPALYFAVRRLRASGKGCKRAWNCHSITARKSVCGIASIRSRLA